MSAPRRVTVPVVDEDEAPLPELPPGETPEAPTARDLLSLDTPIVTTFGELCRAVHVTWYSAIPASDRAGTARVGRTAARLAEALGVLDAGR